MRNIGFIGFGRVAQALSAYLKKKNVVEGLCFCTRNSETPLNFVARQSDIIFIAVPDSAISAVASSVAKLSDINFKGKSFVHLSGAHTSAALSSLENKGAFTASLHPAMTFAGTQVDVEQISNCLFSLETPDVKSADTSILYSDFKSFLNAATMKFVEISPHQKPQYHAALSAASNFLVTLMYYSEELLISSGVDKSLAPEFIYPLAQAALQNCRALGTGEALTGPISRGDTSTIELHLGNLPHEFSDVYTSIGKKTVELALKNQRITKQTAQKLQQMLGFEQ